MNTPWPTGLKEYLEEKFSDFESRFNGIEYYIEKIEKRFDERFTEHEAKEDKRFADLLTTIDKRFEKHEAMEDERLDIILTAIEERFQDQEQVSQLHRIRVNDHERRITRLEKKIA